MVLRAQSSYVLAGDHKITIEGSSNVHDWEEVAQTASGDAARLGAGIMTDARWKATYDLMVSSGQIKPITNWQQAYTLQFVKDLKVMP